MNKLYKIYLAFMLLLVVLLLGTLVAGLIYADSHIHPHTVENKLNSLNQNLTSLNKQLNSINGKLNSATNSPAIP